MVTPRIVYTKEERRRKVIGSLELLSAYGRKNSEAIAVTMRYEPDFQKVTHGDKLILFYSREPFFLSKLHYEQLSFSMQSLGWTLNVTAEEFDKVLDDFIKDLPKDAPLILRIIFRKDGRVDGTAEKAERLESLFAGLFDQIRMSQTGGTEEYTAMSRTKKFACIDSDSTLPCYSTTFDLEDTSPYDRAYRRICEYHAFLLGNNGHSTSAKDLGAVLQDLSSSPMENLSESDTEGYHAEDRDEIIDDSELSEEHWSSYALNRNDVENKLAEIAAIQKDIKEGRRAKITDEELGLDEVLPAHDPSKGLAEHLEVLKDISLYPIMYNPMHQVMSSGIWVLCFFRDGKWYTPHVSSGSRCDPLRMILLEAGLIEEAVIRVQGLEPDEDLLLISSAYGIQRARLFGEAPEELYKYTRNRKRKPPARKCGSDNVDFVARAKQTSLSLTKADPIGRKIPNTNKFKVIMKNQTSRN